MIVYLIRHTSVAVPKSSAYGFTDVPLNPSFETEAAVTQNLLSGLHFEEVFCSPLSRCVKLAAFCGYPHAIRDERLKELNFGDWEMKTWDEITADPYSKEWFNDWINTPALHGESLRQQYERLKAFLSEKKQKGYGQIAVFTHGGILTCARVLAGEYPIEQAFDSIPPYGSVIRIEV